MSKQPIFITGRFRSGTSFMWQLFNQMDGFCAWYEPLHPQLLSCIDYVKPKSDHVGIDDYWNTYRQHPIFSNSYHSEFAFNQLYLEANEEYPELERYINELIELSDDLVPVLQFNRVDLRLSWLKAKFPTATIIHIKRNPLQLYHSQRKHIPNAEKDNNSYWDAYELVTWSSALAAQFPMLSMGAKQHAFYNFYLLYQLSELMGKQHADVSINLDKQVFQSDDFIAMLSSVVALSPAQVSSIKSVVNIPQLPEFDDDLTDQLTTIMTEVDLLMMESGLLENFGKKSLSEIHSQYQHFWSKQPSTYAQNMKLLLSTINEMQSEMTRILAENQRLKQQLDECNKTKQIKSSESNE